MLLLSKANEKLKIELFNNQLNNIKDISLDCYNKMRSQLFELSCDGINETIAEIPEDTSLMKLKIKSTYLLEGILELILMLEEDILVETDNLLNEVKDELRKIKNKNKK